MRVQNSIRNMLFGVSGQVISLVMGFVVRTVFISTLGIEYLGVNGLFSNILTMLSLANLGFDTAIIYSLYKPLAEDNKYKIQALLNLYRRAYKAIGIIVLLLGLMLLPFLRYLMNGETNINNIEIIYILFLINSVSSYCFVYKQSVIIADQSNYIISKINSIFTIISNIVQIVILVITKNYILLLSIQIFIRVIQNAYISQQANKRYPFIKEKNSAKLSKEERKGLFKNLYALMLYKVSGVVINGTDNIVISKFIGIAYVGLYSNYFLITTTINTFLGYIFYSTTASVGNLNVKENEEKKYFVFRILNFLNFWIYGFCSVCIWNLINPFISIWLGERYVLDKFIVFAIVLNFYTAGMQNASTTYRDTTGLFMRGKYRPILAAVINIVTSIILSKSIGIAGVLLGTVISRLCTYFWYDPYVIFKYVFKKNMKSYFIRYIIYIVLVFVTSGISDCFCSVFHGSMVVDIFIRSVTCLVIPNIIFLLVFRESEEFKYLKGIVGQLINRLSFKFLGKENLNSNRL